MKGILKAVIVSVLSVTCTLFTVACDKPKEPEGCKHSDITTVTVTAATCTEDGKEKDVCSACGETLAERNVEKLGHEYGEWKETKAASCSEYGVMERVCVRDCKEIKYTDKLDHTPTSGGMCTECKQKAYSAGLEFTLSDDGEYYIVAGTSVTEEDVIIPSKWKEKPVKKLRKDGFAYMTTMKTVIIPETIEEIEVGAFNNSNSLTTVYWNAVNCKDFAEKNWTFLRGENAEKLNVVFGKKVERIPARMFFPLYQEPDKVTVLETVTFEEGGMLKSVGEYAFYKTTVNAISFPETLETIGAYAFADSALTKVSLGNVKEIGEFSFCSSLNLAEVDFGKNLTSIGNNAFDYCIALKKADLSGVCGALGVNVFKNCEKLEEVVFSDNITVIPERAFFACSSLKTAILGNNTLSIGKEAFAGCIALTEITVGESIETIGGGAFDGCVKVEKLYFNAENCADFESGNKIFENLGRGANGVTVTFGDTVKRVPARMLFTSANSATLPKILRISLNANVEKIGDYAFFGLNAATSFVGSQSEWNAVQVGTNNDCLTSIVCNGGK